MDQFILNHIFEVETNVGNVICHKWQLGVSVFCGPRIRPEFLFIPGIYMVVLVQRYLVFQMLEEVTEVSHVIILSRPDHFNGEVTCLLGNKSSFDGHVWIVPASKTPTRWKQMNVDLIFRNFENSVYFTGDQVRCLCSKPHCASIVGKV